MQNYRHGWSARSAHRGGDVEGWIGAVGRRSNGRAARCFFRRVRNSEPDLDLALKVELAVFQFAGEGVVAGLEGDLIAFDFSVLDLQGRVASAKEAAAGAFHLSCQPAAVLPQREDQGAVADDERHQPGWAAAR